MTQNYLDISKSVMISSPAGSGKTEKLARRYVELLKNGSEVERILAITFTNKAAAEMKERILNILKKENEALFDKVREKIPRMRISTIHAFCLKLLKRFCVELNMDPSIEVMDSFNADVLWSESIYDCLIKESERFRADLCKRQPQDLNASEYPFYMSIKDGGLGGWKKLYKTLNEIHSKRSVITSGIKGSGKPEFKRILSIYSDCLERYQSKKAEKHFIDYSDLELLAYEAISENPEWLNVLYSFDEHTDHILVDEFQDTSTLQWKIIDKLTEEWRSGIGSKRERGMRPTIFLVGDDKQSIYSFRGANVSIFRNARKKLSDWLGSEYHYIEARDNYRSAPVIVDFINDLFERLMPKGLFDDYKVEYTHFEARKQGDGEVRLILADSIGNAKENRRAEASIISRKINELEGRYTINDNNIFRKCAYGDMAVLLRNRTHLSIFEDEFRKEGIPFIVVKGIGFYDAPEIKILKDLLFFLIDQKDDYSLFNILRSPLFSIEYETLLKIIGSRQINDLTSGYLYALLNSLYVNSPRDVIDNSGATSQSSLFETAAVSRSDEILRNAVIAIAKWLEMAKQLSYARVLEEVLTSTNAWKHFHEKQRHLNIKKFIKFVEDFEASGLTRLEIREKLIRASKNSDESKANVNAENMDAVKIMTVHAAKGLQFPMVFVPCLDEENKNLSRDNVVVTENQDDILIAYADSADEKKNQPAFQSRSERLQDEEKRLFYVALTRSMNYLCMSGILKEKPTGKLAYIADFYNLTDANSTSDIPFKIEIPRGESVHNSTPVSRSKKDRVTPAGRQDISYLPVFIEPLDYKPSSVWRDVTEEVEDIRKKHGDDWVVLGRAFHKTFEGISKSYITMDNIENKVMHILRNEVHLNGDLNKMRKIILDGVKRLDESGHLKRIILPQKNSYAELPFTYETDTSIYRGRIDRVIIENGNAVIYDYKTYPIKTKEIPDLSKKYFFQMDIYKRAVQRLFSANASGYIFFTHELVLVPV